MAGCPVCGGPLVNDRERGEVVCAQCGLVVVESAVDTGPEWRVFDEREKRRVRTAPLKLVAKTDVAVKPEHGVQWRRLAKFHRETLHGFERRLSAIGGEIRRVKECVSLPQSVAEEAEALVKRYFDVVGGFQPEVVAVAVLWSGSTSPHCFCTYRGVWVVRGASWSRCVPAIFAGWIGGAAWLCAGS